MVTQLPHSVVRPRSRISASSLRCTFKLPVLVPAGSSPRPITLPRAGFGRQHKWTGSWILVSGYKFTDLPFYDFDVGVVHVNSGPAAVKMTRTILLFAVAALSKLDRAAAGASNTCHNTPPLLSCCLSGQPDLAKANPCCLETFGGLVLSTQFWFTHTTGSESSKQLLPRNSFTLHGLWPDFCNGSWTQYCDLSRQYDPFPSPNTTTGTPSGIPVPPYTGPGVDTFLSALGKPGETLLGWMDKFWISSEGGGQGNAELWAHEFSKHGTCFSTFSRSCFSPSQLTSHMDVFDYFSISKTYFERLPTHKWLAEAGILPRNTSGYTLDKIQNALANRHGAVPYLECTGLRYNESERGKGSTDTGRTVLSEVWYYFHIYGRVQDGNSKAVGADVNGGSTTGCAKAEGAVWYLQRTEGSERDF